MLKRLGTANDEIFDVLVSKNQLLAALRFLRSLGAEAVNAVSSSLFLEAAVGTGDDSLFFTVFKFFEQRNINQRGRPEFVPGEDCERFTAHFRKLFPVG